MGIMNILLVEDNKNHSADFNKQLSILEDAEGISISSTVANNSKIAISLLRDNENSFDSAIIDLNLEGKEEAGIEIIDYIKDNNRMAMIVFSGNANKVEGNPYVLETIAKGKKTYTDIIRTLLNFNNTGIMNILGKKGKLEELINKVYWKNLHPKIDIWEEYANKHDMEEPLLRYTISHLQEELENGVEHFLPEEMYIIPKLNDNISTGTILKSTTACDYYIVMSPACDIQQGCNELVLAKIIEIEKTDEYIDKLKKVQDKEEEIKLLGEASEKVRNEKNSQLNNLKNSLKNYFAKYMKNNINRYHHLVDNSEFSHSIIDFHDIVKINREDIPTHYKKEMSISVNYLKDIQSRFSSYYARQGSPDFDISSMIEKAFS